MYRADNQEREPHHRALSPYTSQKSPIYVAKEPYIHRKRAPYTSQQTLGTPKKTPYSTQNNFNTKQLHNAAAAAHISPEGTLVMVLGPTGRPPDVCTVLGVTRSTVDLLLTRTLLPLETLSFSVDFSSISLIPNTKPSTT